MSNYSIIFYKFFVKVSGMLGICMLVLFFSNCSNQNIFRKSKITPHENKQFQKRMKDPNYDIRQERKICPWHDVRGTYLRRRVPDSLMSDVNRFATDCIYLHINGKSKS